VALDVCPGFTSNVGISTARRGDVEWPLHTTLSFQVVGGIAANEIIGDYPPLSFDLRRGESSGNWAKVWFDLQALRHGLRISRAVSG
jgi:hypothetical protein